jgi:hypothetical protein
MHLSIHIMNDEVSPWLQHCTCLFFAAGTRIVGRKQRRAQEDWDWNRLELQDNPELTYTSGVLSKINSEKP